MIKDRVKCPKCNRTIRYANAWHYCKEVSMDDLFLNKSDDIVLAFYKLLEEVETWEDVEISATKNCIVFIRNKTFLVAKPMSKCLEVKFYSSTFIDDPELFKSDLWNKKHQGVLRLTNEYELKSKFFEYFKLSYDMS